MLGLLLTLWAIGEGVAHAGSSPGAVLGALIAHPLIGVAGLGAILIGGRVAWRMASPRLRRALSELRAGLCVLRSPGDYLRRVLFWQLLARALEVGSLVFMLAAFGLPPSLAAALVALCAQGGGRMVPLAPLSAGVSAAALAYGLSHIGGHAVSLAAATTFAVGTAVLLTTVGLLIAAVILMRQGLPAAPWRLASPVRERFISRIAPPAWWEREPENTPLRPGTRVGGRRSRTFARGRLRA